MRKTLIGAFCCLLALTMALGAAAEVPDEQVLEQLNGVNFVFSSGVGGWETSLTVGENGVFTGQYHDSEMGETGEGYPDGTVYGCLFHGQFSDPVQENVRMWRLSVSLTADEGQLPEYVEDGIRYVTTEPYGLKDGQTVILYLPGTHVDFLPEALLPWTHLNEIDPHAETLPFHVIWNETDESGFVGELPGTLPGAANPWTELNEAEFTAETGFAFGDVEGAWGQRLFLMRETGLAEERFSLGECDLVFRVLEADVFTDISGAHESWVSAEAFNLAWCPGVVWADEDGDAPVRLCLWYDAASGLMYSLSARGQLPEGTDLKEIARVLCAPMLNDGE